MMIEGMICRSRFLNKKDISAAEKHKTPQVVALVVNLEPRVAPGGGLPLAAAADLKFSGQLPHPQD
jgi:hypothetical protein